jgi:dynein heavy chain
MYQYSLSWFIALFVRSIGEAAKHHMVSQRTQSINQTFTHALYRNVCRSLFEKDKLLFSFLLNLKLSQSRKQLNAAELRMLLTGGIVDASAVAASNPASQWLSANAWGEVLNLSKLSAFAGFREDFVTHLAGWQRYFEHRDPFALEELPGGWHQKLSPFQRMLVLRCLRPDKLVHAIQRYVKENMGEAFIQPPPFNLEAAYADSNQCTPLLFILSPGVDPSSEVFKFALSKGFGNLENISLGQGQGPIAEQAIREAVDKGSWVLLQNCHLAVSWLPTLERIVDELSAETTNVNFRLWLTSAPSPLFPVSLLQNGVKMTNEPPKGLRMSLLQSWNGFDDKLFNDASKPQQLKKLLFSLTFFHAVVLERRKFGPLGWNIPYEFTESDLRISVKQLEMLLDQYDEVPFTALKYLVGQLNYGGRVTDDWDRRTLSCLLQDFMNPRVLNDKHQIDSRGIYAVPSGDATTAQVVEYATSLPLNDEPDVFGLDANAEITSAIKESHGLLGALLTLQPKTSNASSGAASGGAAAAAAPQTREAQIAATAREIEARLPAKFDVELASRKFPVVYANSMNTVFVQELIRYNRLLDAVRSSLQSLQRALKGEVVMSDDLEAMATSLFNGMVPKLWSAVAYPSLKPLGAWVGDLLQRLGMFASWLQNGPPSAFWVSGFFFTQSFLTGTMQNYARKYRIPIDELSFDFEVMDHVAEDTKTPPADGCYIYGLFLEGARWDSKLKAVAPSLPKQLFTKMPVIWLKPVHNNSKTSAAAAAAATAATGSATLAPGSAGTKHAYTCPVYKTSRRAGTLSTTGHSTNFVLAINLPCTQDERFWVKRGVALLCQLDT